MDNDSLVRYVELCKAKLKPKGLLGGLLFSLGLRLVVALVRYAVERWLLERAADSASWSLNLERGQVKVQVRDQVRGRIFGSGPQGQAEGGAAEDAYNEVFA